jgi:exonuclease III
MDNCKTNFTITSFNCKHFKASGPKFDFINEIFDTCDIIMLQEHCLYESEFYKIAMIGNGSGVEAVSSMCENVQRLGRPYGGCAIVWNPRLNAKIDGVATNNSRSCAVTINFGHVSFLLINVYMPCDGRDPGSVEYKSVMDDMVQLVNKVNSTYVIIGGDFNTDISRNSSHVEAFSNFVRENCFNICIDKVSSDVPYTFINSGCTSRIDHFLVSDNLRNMYTCCIIDNHLHSDHVPVVLSIEHDVSHQPFVPKNVCKKIAWHRVTDADINLYKSKLDNYLSQIVYNHVALSCTDIKCRLHQSHVESLYYDIINACCLASDHFPVTGQKVSKCIPGWNKYVDEFRKDALTWHHIWKAQGRPRCGDVADRHRSTRAKYHQAVRFVKRNADMIKMEKMAEAISCNNSRDLWKEVKSVKGSNSTLSSCIDGVSSSEGIALLFSEKYNQLYNSVSYDTLEMDVLKRKIEGMVTNQCTYSIGVSDIESAIKQLKCGKSGGCENIYADHIVHGTHKLNVMLSLVYNAMIVHAFSPSVLLTGLLVPIPKDRKKSMCSSDNYRAIALNSILCKVLDLIILIKETSSLCSSDLQFGFKKGLSTTHCTFLLQETVSYYNYNHTNVYTLLLDASKAFDRVNYCKLFERLIEKKMSPVILRLLLYMYTNQKMMVQWDNCTSEKFNISNGVKQGAVLSPILFAVYVDGLLSKLKESGIGCHIGDKYVGALSFADDLTLLCPTLTGLRKMVKICEDYANSYYIKFNGTKSKLLVFRGFDCLVDDQSIVVCNDVVKPSESAVHLGHRLSPTCRDANVNTAKAEFWRSYNIFLANFGHLCSSIKNKLFVQYCCYFYGAPLWNLNGKGVSDLCTSWRKALRNLWSVHYQTHCDIIIGLSGQLPLILNLQARFCRFITKCLQSQNDVVKLVSQFAICNPLSNTGRNYLDLYCLNESNFVVDKKSWFFKAENLSVILGTLKELIEVRDGRMECETLNMMDVNALIIDLCCN